MRSTALKKDTGLDSQKGPKGKQCNVSPLSRIEPCTPQAPKTETREHCSITSRRTYASQKEALPGSTRPLGSLCKRAALVGNYTGAFYEMVLDSFDSFIRILPPEKKRTSSEENKRILFPFFFFYFFLFLFFSFFLFFFFSVFSFFFGGGGAYIWVF
jgi:hypothetical protein